MKEDDTIKNLDANLYFEQRVNRLVKNNTLSINEFIEFLNSTEQ